MHVQLCCRLRLCCIQRSKVKGSWGAREKGNTCKERAPVIRRVLTTVGEADEAEEEKSRSSSLQEEDETAGLLLVTWQRPH